MRIYKWMIRLLVICMFFQGCEKEHDAVIGGSIRQVRGAVVQMKEIPHEINGFGTLSFLKKIDVAAPQDGVIKSIRFREGDVLRSGDLIVELENPRISMAVDRSENMFAQAQAALELSRSKLLEGEFSAEVQILAIEKAEDELLQVNRNYREQERKHKDQEALFDAGGITEEAIRSSRFSLETQQENIRLQEKDLNIRRIGFRDQDLSAAGIELSALTIPEEKKRALIRLSTATLRAELSAAEAGLDAAGKELQAARLAETELTILSPAPGTIGARYFEAGERVKQEDKILTLIDTDSLYAVFPVRESDALLLNRGMAALVHVDATGETYDGIVDLISPSADSQSFTFSVRVLIPPEVIAAGKVPDEASLKPGMFARVSVILGPPRKVIAVPESALFNKRNNDASVFVVSGGILSERTVNMGVRLEEDREILSGISLGEVIVLRPDTNILEGEHVTIVD